MQKPDEVDDGEVMELRFDRRRLLASLGGLLVAFAFSKRLGAVESPGADTAGGGNSPDVRGAVLLRSHGQAVDHIALGVPDMPRALEFIRTMTGAEPYATDPEPGQWYWSGALALGSDCFLEILGPNPQHDGFHPLKELILGYDEPRLLFWYVATDDFDAFQRRLEAGGSPMERIETVDFVRDGARTHYKRGIIGPGFESQRPCVIEWRERKSREGIDSRCRLESLRLRHPDAAELDRLFRSVGIEQIVEQGPSRIALDIATPNGRVTFENPGESFAGVSAVLRTTRLYWRYLTR